MLNKSRWKKNQKYEFSSKNSLDDIESDNFFKLKSVWACSEYIQLLYISKEIYKEVVYVNPLFLSYNS